MRKSILCFALGTLAFTAVSAMADTLVANMTNIGNPQTPGCTNQSTGGHYESGSSWAYFHLTCPNGTMDYQMYQAAGSGACSISSKTTGYYTSGSCSAFSVYKN